MLRVTLLRICKFFVDLARILVPVLTVAVKILVALVIAVLVILVLMILF